MIRLPDEMLRMDRGLTPVRRPARKPRGTGLKQVFAWLFPPAKLKVRTA